MMRSTQRPFSTSLVKHPEMFNEGPYDPTSWMTGSPARGDDFESLAADAALNGRTITIGTGTWVTHAGWTGTGDGAVKVGAINQGAKINFPNRNTKVRVLFHPGDTGNNVLTLNLRDNDPITRVRYGNIVNVYPLEQEVSISRINNYTITLMGGPVHAYILRGWNAVEIKAYENTITAYINGRTILVATDSFYNSARSYVGFELRTRENALAKIGYFDCANVTS